MSVLKRSRPCAIFLFFFPAVLAYWHIKCIHHSRAKELSSHSTWLTEAHLHKVCGVLTCERLLWYCSITLPTCSATAIIENRICSRSVLCYHTAHCGQKFWMYCSLLYFPAVKIDRENWRNAANCFLQVVVGFNWRGNSQQDDVMSLSAVLPELQLASSIHFIPFVFGFCSGSAAEHFSTAPAKLFSLFH